MKIQKTDLLENARILIIEDDFVGRMVIREILKKIGFLHLEEAENGRIGLEKAIILKPHLIITDVKMPEMDGIECTRHIKSNPETQHAAILVQTALNRTDDKASVFEAGADDYITKPIDPYELTARAILQLERQFMLEKLRAYSDRVQAELEIARATQQVLFPGKKMLEQICEDYELKIETYFKTSSELGGDFWGMRSLSNQKLAIYLVDFSGHGVNAALNTFRLHALMHNNLNVADTPGAYLTHLNAILTPLLPPGQFATMFYGVIDFEKNNLSYASAAAPYPVLFRSSGSIVEILRENNLPLGVSADKTYQNREISFHKGDRIFLYSDALIESKNEQGEFLTLDTLIPLMQECFGPANPVPVQEGFPLFLERFKSLCHGQIKDDLTLNLYCRF